MNCRSAEQAMDRALDEAIPGAQFEALEAHLARCPGCRRQWEALRAAEAVLRVPQPVAAPDDLLADFRRRLDAERPVAPRTPARPWLSWLWPAGSVAAAGLAAALAVTFNVPITFDAPPAPAPAASPVPAPTARDTPGNSDRARSLYAVPAPAPTPAAPDRRVHAPQLSRDFGRLSDEAQNRGAKSSSSPAARPRFNEKAAPGSPLPSTLDLAEKPMPGESIAAPIVRTPAPTLGLPSEAVRAQAGRGLDRRPAGGAGTDRLTELDARPESREPGDKPPSASAARAQQNAGTSKASPGAGQSSFHRSLAGPPEARSEFEFKAMKKSDSGDRSLADSEPVVRLRQTELGLGTQNGGFAGGRPMAPGVAGDQFDFITVQEAETLKSRELNVSPAVLTALQRPVDVALRGETLAGAVRQLTEAADVVLAYDPRVAGVTVNVTTAEPQAPLWLVLQEVAQQGNLQIVPRENQIELLPAGTAVGKALPAPKPSSPPLNFALQGAPAPEVRGDAPAPAGAANTRHLRLEPQAASKAAKEQMGRERSKLPMLKSTLSPRKAAPTITGAAPDNARGRDGSRAAPDRRVWPALWGRLPERGFALPTAEALSPVEPGGASKAARPSAESARAKPAAPAKRRTQPGK